MFWGSSSSDDVQMKGDVSSRGGGWIGIHGLGSSEVFDDESEEMLMILVSDSGLLMSELCDGKLGIVKLVCEIWGILPPTYKPSQPSFLEIVNDT